MNEIETREYEEVEESTDVAETVVCSVCCGEAMYMGMLGRLAWYECVYCGTQFARRAEANHE